MKATHQDSAGRGVTAGARRAAAATACFLFALALTLVYLNTVAPNTRAPWNDRLFSHIQSIETAALEGQPYLVVFGSSLTDHNFVPEAFEKELQGRGAELRVFKVALVGAWGHEINYYVRRVIRHLESRNAPMPEYALIDTMLPYSGFVKERDLGTARLAAWHSLRETRNALETLLIQPGRPHQKIEAATTHLKNLIRHYVPVGRFHSMTVEETVLASEERRQEAAGIEDASGIAEGAEFDEAIVEAAMIGGLSRDQAERFARRVHRKRQDILTPVDLTRRNTAVVRRQIEFLLEHGVLPVYIVPPSFGDPSLTHELTRRGALPYVAALDDPAAHPDLWRPEERRDVAHLKAGAPSERYSRKLATAVYENVIVRRAEYDRQLRESLDSWNFED